MYRNQFRPDGSVILWNPYAGAWQSMRAKQVTQSLMASLTAPERVKVADLARAHP